MMTSLLRALLRFATISIFLQFGAASFPENSRPVSVTSFNDVPNSFFTGGDAAEDLLRYTQDLKMVKVAGKDYYAVTGREKLFLVNPDDFSPTASRKIPYSAVYTWKTDEKKRNLCVMKGQGEENCENYIRVLEQIDSNGDTLLLCATNSYEPLCEYLTATTDGDNLMLKADDNTFSGTEKCAFGPDQTGVSLYAGESLYSATVSEFSGRSYTITRSLGEDKQLRTPKFDSKFLNEPYFVKMIDDDERVLIFMNEVVRTENGDVRMVAYVAQVCKNDVGGQHVLVRQWTKFEKTRLNCSLNGFYFDQLQDISEPVEVRTSANSEKSVKTIYATFTTPEYSVPGSAVCAFTIDSIHEALVGRFREERSGVKSDAPTGAQHPGNCPNRQYTESELLFLKSHPLLEDQARGTLLTTHVGERWTSVAVDTQAGPNKNWTVYFVGTTHGEVLRYLAPTGGLKHPVLLRRQDVYDTERCGSNATDEQAKSVNRIVIDSERDQILVTFKHCVTSVPLRSCSVHKCKDSCIASADPYCGWNGTLCVSYTRPSVNIEQYVFSEATHPKSNIENLCPQEEIVPVLGKDGDKGTETTTSKKDNNGVAKGDNGGRTGPEHNITNGTFVVDGKAGEGGVISQPQGTTKASNGYLQWQIVVVIAGGTAILSFVIGIIVSKKCCQSPKSDVEKQPGGMEESKASTSNSETLCKRFLASISPQRKRKPSMKPPHSTLSQATLTDQQGEPLVTKEHNKLDEYVKHHDPSINGTLPHTKSGRKSGSRLNSASSSSQVTMTESLPAYPSSRRQSAQPQPTSSLTSMSSKGRSQPQYATAPRPRHYSGNRTSDPADYSNAPTLRADRTNSRMSSRHSTPNPTFPATPTSAKEFNFVTPFDSVVESTEHVLDGVREVIEQQQRRSAEMEPVIEESEDARLRHDSSDSGKGSSPRNSVQTEEQDKLSSLSRSRPENIPVPGPQRGRKRLNSEPTSPTTEGPPLPPPSSHKPVMRSTSMRAQHAMSVPNYAQRKRSESFSVHQSPQGSPLRMQQMVQNGFQPQAQPNLYATLPTKPQMANTGHPAMENFNRQQPYETYSPNNRYPMFDQRDHPAMNLPDRYSSLPLRSQAHRSNKKQYVQQQYVPHPAQMNGRKTSSTQQIAPPTFHKQMSSPANFDQQRSGQRPRYVPTPTVPGYPVPLREQDAV